MPAPGAALPAAGGLRAPAVAAVCGTASWQPAPPNPAGCFGYSKVLAQQPCPRCLNRGFISFRLIPYLPDTERCIAKVTDGSFQFPTTMFSKTTFSGFVLKKKTLHYKTGKHRKLPVFGFADSHYYYLKSRTETVLLLRNFDLLVTFKIYFSPNKGHVALVDIACYFLCQQGGPAPLSEKLPNSTVILRTANDSCAFVMCHTTSMLKVAFENKVM